MIAVDTNLRWDRLGGSFARCANLRTRPLLRVVGLRQRPLARHARVFRRHHQRDGVGHDADLRARRFRPAGAPRGVSQSGPRPEKGFVPSLAILGVGGNRGKDWTYRLYR